MCVCVCVCVCVYYARIHAHVYDMFEIYSTFLKKYQFFR